MQQINTKVKKWGNSFGIILPKSVVDAENIQENLEISLIINTKPKTKVKDLMEFTKKHPLKFKTKTKQALEKVDKELWLERK